MVPESEALNYVFGYTVGNDVTAPQFFHEDGHWTIGKSFDTFSPLGPVIETELDTFRIHVEAKLNGFKKQDRPPCRKKFGTIGRMKTNIVEITPCSWGHEVDASMVRKSPKDRRTPVAWCTTECRSRVGKHAG